MRFVGCIVQGLVLLANTGKVLSFSSSPIQLSGTKTGPEQSLLVPQRDIQLSAVAVTGGEDDVPDLKIPFHIKHKERQKSSRQPLSYDDTLVEMPQKQSQSYPSLAQGNEELEQLQFESAESSFSESALRSAVKALCWRAVAGSVTFFTTLKFSGSVATALRVVGSDFVSKAITMFIGERLMNKSQAGRRGGSDNVRRSLVKAMVWRMFAIANTLVAAALISKDLNVASKVASTDAVFKTALMFGYERVWAGIPWGWNRPGCPNQATPAIAI